MNPENQSTYFAPQLFLVQVKAGMEFYTKAFGAVELRRWSNPDGSVHVAEMAIEGAMFHLHEEVPSKRQRSPIMGDTTSLIGIFTHRPDKLWQQALLAGAVVGSPMQDYEYGYRQGTLIDPFGHQWLIEKKI